MSLSRGDLERLLLADPFDNGRRAQYAGLLLSEGEADAALAQFDIVLRQASTDPALYTGRARTLLALGRDQEALAAYAAASHLPGFVPDETLDARRTNAGVAAPQRLVLLDGGRAGNVVELTPPPARRERIGFDDIAGLVELKRIVRLQIIEPFLRPGLFARLKKSAGGGVLLYGPPGCGKTMLARAVATECNAEFMSVGIGDVISPYHGISEQNLAAIFDRARASRPCVLFFDEIDALAFARSKAQSEHTRQIVNELLSQLDGFGTSNQDVLILAATNMPWDVDSAAKRPGRFSRQVFVSPPDEPARAQIVQLKLAGVPHEAIDEKAIAAATPHFSGADIEGLVELAKDFVLEDHLASNIERAVTQADLLKAAGELNPSTLDWLRTARNLIKYGGADRSYAEVERYLKRHKID
jgi:AAA+ superfamily predicted ATPase